MKINRIGLISFILLVTLLMMPFGSTITAPVSHKPVCEKITEECGNCSWPEYRHDNFNTGFIDDQCAPPCDDLEKLWRFTLSSNDHILAPPSVDCGKVVFGTETGSLYALRAYNGMVAWGIPLFGPIVSTPTIYNKKVFVGTKSGAMYCVDLDNGNILWVYPVIGQIVASPKVLEGKVFFGTTDGSLHCVNSVTGGNIWTYNTLSSITTAPTVGYGHVWFQAGNGYIYSLKMNKGEIEMGWPRSYAQQGNNTVLAYDDNKLYYSNNTLQAIEAFGGNMIPSAFTPPSAVTEPAVDPRTSVDTDNARQYVGTDKNTLFKLRDAARSRIWSNNQIRMNGLNSSPSVTQRRVYLTSNGQIYVIDASTGSVLNRISVPLAFANEQLTSVAIAYQRLYFASTSCSIYSYGCCKVTDDNADECNNSFDLIITAQTGAQSPYPVGRCCKMKFNSMVVDNCSNIRPEFADKITFELSDYSYASIGLDGTLTVDCKAPIGETFNVRAHLVTSFIYKGRQINIDIVSPWLSVIVTKN